VLSVVVFIITIDFVSEHIKKNEISKYSQPSDWIFVIWLFLEGFTVYVVRLFNMPGFLKETPGSILSYAIDYPCALGIDNRPIRKMDSLLISLICNVFC
jgi:hypothetical protein